MISKYSCAIGLRGSALQIGRQIVPIEDVVTQDQRGMILPDEFAADDKCLRQTVRERVAPCTADSGPNRRPCRGAAQTAACHRALK